MADRRSRSAAAFEPPRARVLPAWSLAAVGICVIAVLILLFPRQQLLDSLRNDHSGEDRALALSYLQNLLRSDPRNSEVRTLLVQRQIEQGEIQAARATLAPLLADADAAVRQRARWTQYKLLSEQGQAPSATEAQALFADLETQKLKPEVLLELMHSADAWGQAAAAQRLSQRLLGADGVSAEVFDRAARSALSLSRYANAAQFWFAAQARAENIDAQRLYFLRALSTLQSGNLLREALSQGDTHIGALRDDEQCLLLMLRIARAANDQPRAQTYARRLMHWQSQQSMLQRLLARAFDALLPQAHAADEASDTRAFDETIYTLSYDTFVGNRNFDEAYRVAAAAVAQRPNDLAWRARLARVCEWMGRPQKALQQWRYLAAHSDSDEATQGVLRLAPGLNEQSALLETWQRIGRARALSAEETQNLAQLFEQQGEPAEGIAYFEKLYRQRHDSRDLQTAADLSARREDVGTAIALYRRLQKDAGLDAAQTLRLATLYFEQGDFDAAYQLLHQAQANAPADATAFWRLYGEIAWRLQHDDAALIAYRHLQQDKPAPYEIQRLVQLLRPHYPAEAAQIAAAAYARLHEPALLLPALEYYSQQNDQAELQRLFAQVDTKAEAQLATTPYFFILRANHRLAQQQTELAQTDYQRALALAPQDASMVQAWLWFLIDRQQHAQLQTALRRYRSLAARNEELWEAYAAGYQSLGQTQRALKLYKRQAHAHRDDYLWLLNYADALEQNGAAASTLRVRRRARALLQQAPQTTPQQARQRMLAIARLTVMQSPGDASLKVVRHLLREDRADSGNAALDAAAQNLAASWMLSTGQYEKARAWMWQRQARKLAVPAEMQLALALEQQDRNAIKQVLQKLPDDAAPADRIEAANLLDQPGLAQSIGFAAMSRAPDDDALHEQSEAALRRNASRLELGTRFFDYSPLRGHAFTFELPWRLSEHASLSPFGTLMQQSSDNKAALVGVPGQDREYGLALRWQQRDSDSEIALSQREALKTFTVLRAAHWQTFGPRLNLRVELAYNARANDSVPLLVGGSKDEAQASLNYAFSKREYLNLGAALQRFHTQDRGDLGDGRRIDLELGHRFRIDYPDLSLRAYVSRQQYDARAQADASVARLNPSGAIPSGDFFLPQSFNYYSLSLGFGQFLRGPDIVQTRLQDAAYSRALRPFADAGLTYNSVSGSGYNFLGGIGGSVFGNDFVSLYLLHSDGGTGAGAPVREIALQYRRYF